MSVPDERLTVLPAPPVWLMWVETVALTVAPALVGHVLRPADPFYVHGAFCWPMLGALLVALRYGFLHGVAATFLQLGMLAWQGWADVPTQLAAGLVVSTLVAGELSDRLRRRISRAERIALHATKRIDGFVRAYHALNASHDRLLRREQSSTATLREALSAFRRRVACGVVGAREQRDLEATMLELFAEFAGVQIAAYHPIADDGGLQPAATMLGSAVQQENHPLLIEALERREVMSVGTGSTRVDDPVGPLIAVPLVTSGGQVLAVISVQELPFIAFHEGTLQLLAVLAGRLADLLADFARRTPASEERHFLTELRRCVTDRKLHRLHSSIVRVSINVAEATPALAETSADRRAADHAWVTNDASSEPVLLLLLPLTSKEGAETFTQRIEELLRGRYGGLLPAGAVRARTREIKLDDSVETLLAFAREPEQISVHPRRVRSVSHS